MKFSILKYYSIPLTAANGINQSCTQQSQCSAYGDAFCSANPPKRCTCHEYTTYDAEKELCVRKIGLGGYCRSSEPCNVANSACTPNNICVCKENFVDVDGVCKPSEYYLSYTITTHNTFVGMSDYL